jgi:Tol biopolymer transport system component
MGGAHVYAPTWSPDGSRIAFACDRDHNYDLYVIPSDGGEPEQLTSDPADDTAPSWSQNGNSLLFTSNRTGRFEVWSLPIGGGEPTQVTQHGGGGARLSRDGRFLYFAKSPVEPTEIFRMPVGGGEEVPILERSERVTHYAVGARGIYFITAPNPQLGTRLRFYEFASQTTRDLSPFSASSSTATCACEYWVGHGMAVSPDEKTLLFGRLDSIESDLMLVEHFR